MNTEYEQLKRIIADSECVDFGEFGDGVSSEWIKKAEDRLGFALPPSYVWWLKNYGGGEVYGNEIFSIYEQDFDNVAGCDLVHMYELKVREGIFSEDDLVICEFDDVVFYFDLKQRTEDNEAPIYEYNTKKRFADNFVEFLRKMIQGEAVP